MRMPRGTVTPKMEWYLFHDRLFHRDGADKLWYECPRETYERHNSGSNA